ncbi:MAG: PD-(D/E)XK nuclease family protein, partial [Acidimicrobiales bacterium]|nr:PD-(D/E)XK nuclease family protein [Acidimicrobiales bacterium]
MTDPPLASLPKTFSPSAASTYDKCPRRWRYRYIEKLPDPPGEAALIGTFAHRVLELLCREDPSLRTVEQARDLAREVWSSVSAQKDYRALNLQPKAEHIFRWKSWTAIEGLWDLEDPAEVKVRSTEQHLSAEI